MDINLGDAELKVMDVLWDRGEMSAKALSDTLNEKTGWNKNTTYTLIRRLIDKCAVERTEPGFMCRALVTREAVRGKEVRDIVGKLFDGSASLLFASLLSGKLPDKERKALIEMVEKLR